MEGITMSNGFNKVLCVSWGVNWSKVAQADYMAEIRVTDPDLAKVIDDLDYACRLSHRIKA